MVCQRSFSPPAHRPQPPERLRPPLARSIPLLPPPPPPPWPAPHQPLDPSQAPTAVVRLSAHCAALGLSEAGWRQLQRQLGGFTDARAMRALAVLDRAAIQRLNAGRPSLDEEGWFAAGRPHR